MSNLSPKMTIFTALVFALMMLGSFSARADDKKVITIAADEWCPINCAEGSDHEGIGIEIARKVYEKLGYTVRYKVMPWDQAIAAVTDGSVDAVVGANANDSKKLVFPETPLGLVSDSLYTRQDKPLTCQNLDCLKGLRLGVINDYGYSPALQSYIEENRKFPGTIFEASGNDALEENIKKLMSGEVDVIAESSIIMLYTLNQMKLSNSARFVYSFPYEDVFLGFSPAHSHSRKLADLFDEGMKKLRQDGGLDSVYSRYGIVLE